MAAGVHPYVMGSTAPQLHYSGKSALPPQASAQLEWPSVSALHAASNVVSMSAQTKCNHWTQIWGSYLGRRWQSMAAKGPRPSSRQGRPPVSRALPEPAGWTRCRRSWPAGRHSPTACCCTAGSCGPCPGHSSACTSGCVSYILRCACMGMVFNGCILQQQACGAVCLSDNQVLETLPMSHHISVCKGDSTAAC